MKKIACMFPGQGSQTIGMGQELYDSFPEIKELYTKANDLLNFDITNLMFNGPQEDLTETENAQPALLLSSIASFSLLKKAGILPAMVVGHSLGEYSALVAADAITMEEALPLVKMRGQLMEAAFPKGQGTMAAVLGLTEEEITEVLSELPAEEIVDMANLNCPGQIVISGTQKGVELASDLLKNKGARRVLPLNVSGPFHSRLMKPANEKFSQSLNEVSISNAKVPVYANVTANAVTDQNEIKDLLIKQLYSPVRFEQSISNMINEDVDAFVEVGTGNVLSGLVKKVNRKVKTFQIQDVASYEKFLAWYKEDASC